MSILELWKVQLKDIMQDLKGLSYVILRLDTEFPNIGPHQDIDILTTDIDRVMEIIKKKVKSPFKVRSKLMLRNTQWHLDIYHSWRFIFKFDLYRDIAPVYKLVKLHPDCAKSIVDQRVTINRNGIDLQVPKLSTDLSLRYLEYVEKKRSRPDKIKHLRYIEKFPGVEYYKVTKGEENVNFC